MNRNRIVLALTATLVLLISMVGTVSAAATITPSTDVPVTGEEITFTVGTTLEGLEADISVTGLTFVSNTGLGNASHAITVPGMGTAYTYRVTAEEGQTVSFVLSDVKEATTDGQEVEGQTVSWMGTAQRAAEPTPTPSASEQPTESPSTEPTPTQNPDESAQPSQSADQTPAPSGNPSPTPTPVPPQNTAGSSGGSASGGITGGTTGGATGGAGTTGGNAGTTGANPPKTGDISHFWIWVGIGAGLTFIVIAAGKRVFAD